jgi:hypothetical protein
MVGDVIVATGRRWVALVTADLHGVARHAATRSDGGGGASAADHGASSCRDVSVRMKIGRPWRRSGQISASESGVASALGGSSGDGDRWCVDLGWRPGVRHLPYPGGVERDATGRSNAPCGSRAAARAEGMAQISTMSWVTGRPSPRAASDRIATGRSGGGPLPSRWHPGNATHRAGNR